MIRDALEHLTSRECTLGGYTSMEAVFYPRDCQCETIAAMVFTAGRDSCHFMGPAAPHTMAREILLCSGPNGTNAEYVLFLAWFLRRYIPESIGSDAHLDDLERALRHQLTLQQKTEECVIRSMLKPDDLYFEKCEFCSNSEITQSTSPS